MERFLSRIHPQPTAEFNLKFVTFLSPESYSTSKINSIEHLEQCLFQFKQKNIYNFCNLIQSISFVQMVRNFYQPLLKQKLEFNLKEKKLLQVVVICFHRYVS